MSEDINLCEILKGCEGIELYSSVYGKVKLCKIFPKDIYPIRVKPMNGGGIQDFTKEGKFVADIGECTLFPSKEQRDWSKFERPILVDTPMMVSSYTCIDEFRVGFYAGKINGLHECFLNGLKHSDTNSTGHYKYIIPFDKFNPNDIEESLKYNIQK